MMFNIHTLKWDDEILQEAEHPEMYAPEAGAVQRFL